MNYDSKFTTHNIPGISRPDGISEKTKYTFSITYTDQHSMDYAKFAETTKDIISREGNILAPYPDPQGDLNLRNLISERLASLRGIKADADSIFISSWAGGAISNLINIFLEPNDTVLVEEFSYSGTLGMLLTKKANIIHVDSDENGILPDSLEEHLANLKSENITPKFIYLISVFQNPTGITIPLERRKAIIELAQKYNVPIIENESYADFRIDGDPLPPAMYGMDDTDSVMYISAYTKFLGCGIRIGYTVVPDMVKEELAKTAYNGMPSQLASMAVFNFLDKHGYKHGLEVEQSIMKKRDAMLTALKENFPDTCEWNKPNGGLMVWLKLPEGANSWDILRSAVDRGVKYNPGGVYRADREKNNYLRLTYSYNTPNEIHEGIKILADVFEKEKLI